MTKFAVAKNLSNDKIPSVPVLCRLSLSVVSTIVAILILASFAAAASSTLTAFKTLSPIVLDGNLSEQAWRQANSVTFLNRQKSDNVVTVSALWDDVNLYLAYDVDDDQLEAVNDALSLDDGAELYIDAQNNKSLARDSNDYSFFANINDITKPTSIVSKTTRRSGGYTMEIRIPWNAVSTVPAAGKVL